MFHIKLEHIYGYDIRCKYHRLGKFTLSSLMKILICNTVYLFLQKIEFLYILKLKFYVFVQYLKEYVI